MRGKEQNEQCKKNFFKLKYMEVKTRYRRIKFQLQALCRNKSQNMQQLNWLISGHPPLNLIACALEKTLAVFIKIQGTKFSHSRLFLSILPTLQFVIKMLKGYQAASEHSQVGQTMISHIPLRKLCSSLCFYCKPVTYVIFESGQNDAEIKILCCS